MPDTLTHAAPAAPTLPTVPTGMRAVSLQEAADLASALLATAQHWMDQHPRPGRAEGPLALSAAMVMGVMLEAPEWFYDETKHDDIRYVTQEVANTLHLLVIPPASNNPQ